MTVADYLSLVRIPLGVMFLLVVDHTGLALGVLAAAALSDVLDGWVARRQRRATEATGAEARGAQAASPPEPLRGGSGTLSGSQATMAHHRGDWLDPLCDKLFVAAVVLALYIERRPPLTLLALMLTREILQTISVTVLRLVPTLHRASRDYDFKAHPLGKATTVVQFVAGAALLVEHPLAPAAAYLTAVLGVITVGIYISRVRRILPAAAGQQSDRSAPGGYRDAPPAGPRGG